MLEFFQSYINHLKDIFDILDNKEPSIDDLLVSVEDKKLFYSTIDYLQRNYIESKEIVLNGKLVTITIYH